MHEWWTHYCNYALAILSVSTTSFAAARDEAGQQGHLRSPRRDCFLTPTSAKTQASLAFSYHYQNKKKKNFAHARIGLSLTGNRGWVSLKQSIPGSQCRPCFPDAGFTYCSCRQSARQGLRHPRYLGAENGGTPCLLCHPHSDSLVVLKCAKHILQRPTHNEPAARLSWSYHMLAGGDHNDACRDLRRSKAVWSHTSVTSHRPCLQYQIDFILPLTSCRVFSERDCMD
mgnify:CR=1 FL=1